MKVTIPLGRSILVRAEPVEKLSSGLFLPGADKAQVNGERMKLVVMCWGSKVEEKYKEGDTLIISSGQCTPVTLEPDEPVPEHKTYLIHETQVVGIRRSYSDEEIPF